MIEEKMIQTFPIVTNYFTNDERLLKFMPHPEETMDGNDLYCEYSIPEYEYISHAEDCEAYIQYHWRALYEMAVRKVTNIVMGRNEHFIVRYIPTAFHGRSLGMDEIKLRVIYELMVVPTKNYIIPVFTYSEITHAPIEWRCGYCASPNEMKERHCTQCGAPRALLLQESPN
jgi:hypothetical protein